MLNSPEGDGVGRGNADFIHDWAALFQEESNRGFIQVAARQI